MKILKRNVPLWAVILVLLAGTSVAFGSMLVYYDIQTTMRIKMTVMLNVLDVDGVTPLETITLGDFIHEQGKYYPGGLIGEIPTEYYFVNNTDEMPFYVGYYTADVPEGVTLRMYIRKGNETDWVELDESANPIYPELIESGHTNPDPNTQFAHWYLTVYVTNTAPFGDFTPTLAIAAYDTPAG